MEFVRLSRYQNPNQPEAMLSLTELRKMDPIWLTQDLKIYDHPENIQNLKELASRGLSVLPIRRRPPDVNFSDRLEFPRRILFEMTSRCNYLCRMCPQNNLRRPRMDMDGRLYRAVIDEIDRYGVEGLWLYHLGESLLHPEWKENIFHIKNKNNLGYIWLSTNGRLFSEEYIRIALDSNISYINFSANAVTEETYNAIVASTGHDNFKIVSENLDTLYRLKGNPGAPSTPFIRVQMIEQETTCHEIDTFIEKHHKKADIVSINLLEYVNLPNNAYGERQRDRQPLTSCSRVSRNDCFICSNGDVTLCDGAYNGEILLGNVHQQSVYNIWNGPVRRKILDLNDAGRMTEIGFCRNCWDYDI